MSKGIGTSDDLRSSDVHAAVGVLLNRLHDTGWSYADLWKLAATATPDVQAAVAEWIGPRPTEDDDAAA